jgi:hypothetical protein
MSVIERRAAKSGSGTIALYHGSKGGLSGDIRPVSREFCDFGKGFYMGTEKLQTLTLVCNFPAAKLYTMRINLTGLQVLDLELGIDWALQIAYHRGKLESVRGSDIYQKCSNTLIDCDIVVGYIANDRMFTVLDQFFSGGITDVALVNSLSALELGKQYVALTEKACSKIEILEGKPIGSAERETLRQESERLRQEGIRKAEEIYRRHRRDGRFFDEIISGGYNQNA